MPSPPRLSDWLMLLALTVMWGSAFSLTKLAVNAIPPSMVVTGRLVVASGVLLLLMILLRRSPPLGRRLWLFLALIALFGNTLPFSLISWGQQHIDSGLAGILMAVMPLITLVLAHFFIPGERLTSRRTIGFVLGFVGIVVLIGPARLTTASLADTSLLAMLAVLAGAGCYAISTILARLRPSSEVVGSALLSTLFATTFSLPFGQPVDVSLDSAISGYSAWLAVIGLGVFSTALAAIVYFHLINETGPSFVSQLNYLIPLWAVVIGVVFLGEAPQTSQFYALALILGGILITQLPHTNRSNRPRERVIAN